jgi:glutamate--cysteine ligase catalytic subunit
MELTLDEIVNGSQRFVGLLTLVHAYLDAIDCDAKTRSRVYDYLSLISKRASGQLPTAAEWMRSFVTSHPLYRRDGEVTPQIGTDLLNACEAIGMGRVTCPELLGNVSIEPVDDVSAFDIPLSLEFPSDSIRRERLLTRAQELRGRRAAVLSDERELNLTVEPSTTANGTAISH